MHSFFKTSWLAIMLILLAGCSNEGLQTDIDGGIQIEVKRFSDCFATEDQTYGMECFVNKVKEKEFKNK